MIAIDATSKKDWPSIGTTHTWAHTCSGSDRALIVSGFQTGGNPPSSVTFNGDALTIIDDQDSYTGDSNNVFIAGMVNPDAGTYNIVVTYGASVVSNHVGASYTGVRQTGFPDAGPVAGAGSASTTSQTDSLTTATDNCWLISAVYDVDNASTVSNGVKRIHTALATGIDDSNGARTPAGTQTMQWTWGSAARFGAHITIAIAPAVTGQVVTITDTLSLTESPSILRGLKSNISDTLNLTENIASLRNRIINISDNIGLTGALTAARNIIISVSDNIGLTEFISWLNGKVISVSDNLGLAETLNTIKSYFINVSDAIGLTGTITTIKTYIISVSDSIGLTEGISIIRNLIVRVSDSIGLTELLATIYKSFYKTPPIQVNVELNTAQANIELETASELIELNTANIDIEVQSGSADINL